MKKLGSQRVTRLEEENGSQKDTLVAVEGTPPNHHRELKSFKVVGSGGTTNNNRETSEKVSYVQNIPEITSLGIRTLGQFTIGVIGLVKGQGPKLENLAQGQSNRSSIKAVNPILGLKRRMEEEKEKHILLFGIKGEAKKYKNGVMAGAQQESLAAAGY